MKPEDRARRDDLASDLDGWSRSDGVFLLRIIDEQAAKLNEWREAGAYLRLKSSGPSHSAGSAKGEVDNLVARAVRAETQLAEELAKRETAETHKALDAGFVRNLRVQLDKVERELAEERETHKRHYEERAHYHESYFGEFRRAEKAEARLGEYLVAVSKAVYPGATKHPAFDSSWVLTELDNTLENYQERVAELERYQDTAQGDIAAYATKIAELQALVDATTPSVEIRDEQFVHVNGQFIVQEKPIYARGIAGRLRIALARDLAAKEKEPK